MSRDGSGKKQSRLYQTMTPIFLLQQFENRQFNMCLNGTCVSLRAPPNVNPRLHATKL